MSNINMMGWGAIVLAAGKGTRMKSDLPKVLHRAAGQPMVARVLGVVQAVGITKQVLVIGGDVEKFNEILDIYKDAAITLQSQRKGTADAVAAAGYALQSFTLPPYAEGKLLRGDPIKADYLLICTGDTPCLSALTLSDFLSQGLASGAKVGVIGMIHPQPFGYGRIILDDEGRLVRIVEEKEASPAEQKLKLCNSGIVYCERDLLARVLGQLSNNNQSREYYLTDIFEVAAKLGHRAFVYQTNNYQEFDGVNTPEQLEKVADWLVNRGER